MDAGLLLARMVFGLLMAAHGSQKAVRLVRGLRPGRDRRILRIAGLPAGPVLRGGGRHIGDGRRACWSRWACSGRWARRMIIAIMIVAMATVHWQHGLFAQNNGIELPLLNSAGAAAIALVGNGAYSLDAALGLSWPVE